MDNKDLYRLLVALKAKAPEQFNLFIEYLNERKIQTACAGMAPNSDQFTHMVQGAYKELDSLVTLLSTCEQLKSYSENEEIINEMPFVL